MLSESATTIKMLGIFCALPYRLVPNSQAAYFAVRMNDSRGLTMHCFPYGVSSAPPPPADGECCTCTLPSNICCTRGVYPMDTESPIISADGSVLEGDSSGPGVHTCTDTRAELRLGCGGGQCTATSKNDQNGLDRVG